MMRTIKTSVVAFLSIMIISCGLFLAVDINEVYAAEDIASGTCGNNLSWVIEADNEEGTQTLTITGSGDMIDLTNVSKPWADYKKSITDIVIGGGVTSIGADAFIGCSSLKSITIPDSIKKIGEYAFSGCSSLASCTIPEGVSKIEPFTFSGCSSLSSIDIPNSVKEVGSCAFQSCSALNTLELPDQVNKIGSSAFRLCSNLKNIEMPATVTNLGSGAFYGCSKLEHFTLPTNLTAIETETFYNCSSLKSITMNNTVKNIYANVFTGCSKLTDIYIYGSGTLTVYSGNDYYSNANIHRLPSGGLGTWTTIQEATCNTEGEAIKFTPGSSIIENSILPTNDNHNWSTWSVHDGIQERVCSACGKREETEIQESPLQFDKDNVTINVYNDYSRVEVTGGDVEKVVSGNSAIATCSFTEQWDGKQYIYIEPAGEKLGTTKITVTDKDGLIKEITVTVKSDFKLSYSTVTVSQSYNSYFQLSDPDDYVYNEPLYVICARSPLDDSGNIILREDEFNGYCPYSKVIYSEAVSDNYGDFYNEGDGTIYIKKAVSKNTSVVTLRHSDYGGGMWEIIPKATGTATIECTDGFGQKANLKVVVSSAYTNSYVKAKTSIGKAKYGSTALTGKTISGAKITVSYGGKKYTATANSSGQYSIKVPVKKIGTAISFTVSWGGGKYSVSRKIIKPGTSISTSKVYRSSKTIKVTAKNVHKGDKIVVKVGKKSYTKKIKKNAKKITYTQKIKKTKEGTTIKITAQNKFKQNVASKSVKVYYASKIKKGMTKKQCKLVPGWEHPSDKYVSGSWETWYYDDNTYLEFYKGKLYGWHY